MNEFKDMLIYLRKREGLSQLELGERLNLTKSTISMYENGKRKPSFEVLEAIADYFNVSMNFLMAKEPSPTPEPSNIAPVSLSRNVRRINVLGSVPAGVPTEAVEDIIDWGELPEEMFSGGREYFGLRVAGDSASHRNQSERKSHLYYPYTTRQLASLGLGLLMACITAARQVTQGQRQLRVILQLLDMVDSVGFSGAVF